jgi:hypothetical protein
MCVLSPLSAGLLLLPAPLAANAFFLHAEVELLDVVLLAQHRAAVFHDDAAVLQHVAVVGHVERHVRVLLHQQDGRAVLPVDAHDDLEDLLRQLGAQAQAGLVEQDHLRRGHQGACDGQHLLLAAGQQAGVLPLAFAQDREVAQRALDVPRHGVAVTARVGAHQQVVAHRQQREDLAALGDVAQAQADDRSRISRGDVLAAEMHAAAVGVDDPGDRLQDRRLARAIAAEHGGDLALAHLQADAADRLDRAVGALDVGQDQDLVGHQASLRSEATSSAEPR